MTKKYEPSNGSEGMWFIDKFCDMCDKDRFFSEATPEKGCKILAASLLYDIDDERYPAEWTYDEHNNPTCTAYVERSYARRQRFKALINKKLAKQLRFF
jgi:hypothetical protein